jgi:hypothetical protein
MGSASKTRLIVQQRVGSLLEGHLAKSLSVTPDAGAVLHDEGGADLLD